MDGSTRRRNADRLLHEVVKDTTSVSANLDGRAKMTRRGPIFVAAFTLVVVALTLVVVACGSSMSPMSPSSSSSPSKTLNVAGSWSGTSFDSQGATVVTWTITQSGTQVSGTVTTQAPDPLDGSCNSCHRNKHGTFSGTINATLLTMNMEFAAGVDGDPTPICSSTMTGSASSAATGELVGAYTGSDSCEGAFLNGTLTMNKR
jgi:hypothetical protein